MKKTVIALAGQPNSGKSTLFNSLTGSRQHVANYPGVTVEKKTGSYNYAGDKLNLIDLPGTYSLTAYSPEELISRNILLSNESDLILSVVDVLNLERQIALSFQLIEMERPILLAVNKKDIAKKRGIELDIEKLSSILDLPVFYGNAKKPKEAKELKELIKKNLKTKHKNNSQFKISYTKIIEETISEIDKLIGNKLKDFINAPNRWLAIKLLENDTEIKELFKKHLSNAEEIFALLEERNLEHEKEHNFSMEVGIAYCRNKVAEKVISECVKDASSEKQSLSDKIDSVLLHRLFGPVILLTVMYAFYWLTMVGGQKISDKILPWFHYGRSLVANYLPAKSLLHDGILRGLVLNGIIDGAIMILNYVPIFFVMYLAIEFLEYTGYMSRIAFIMDRVLRAFGLHGQSTLPILLSGAVVGGCAVPGIMATRTIRDKQARLLTILIIPLLNCMSKIPFYVLMTGIFFKQKQAFVLWSFSVATLIVAMLVAKLFSKTIVKGEPEPFVLELPEYQLPSLKAILINATERIWLFIKKVASLVLAVAILMWVGVNFPAPSKAKMHAYKAEYQKQIDSFYENLSPAYAEFFKSEKDILNYQQFARKYKMAKRVSDDTAEALFHLNKDFVLENPVFAKIAMKGVFIIPDSEIENFTSFFEEYKTELKNTQEKSFEELYSKYKNKNSYYFALIQGGNPKIRKTKFIDKDAKKMYKLLSRLIKTSGKLKQQIKDDTLNSSILGRAGKFLEPVTSLAGLDWRMNVAVIGSFMAKEALVSTLGTIYSIQNDENMNAELDNNETANSLERGVMQGSAFRPIHALAIMIFIAFFPPCVATMIMSKIETGSWKWLIFQICYPIVLGFISASLVFQIGSLLGF